MAWIADNSGAIPPQLLRLEASMKFDWHRGPINRATKVDETYKSTQNVRRFLTAECGETFRFDRSFVAWSESPRS